MSAGPLLPLATPLMILVVACAATARAVGGDLMLGAELALALLVGTWLTLLARDTARAVRSQRQLERAALPIQSGQHLVQLLDACPEPRAFVAGPLRPAIFVSRALLDALDPEETAAVLLHEEHHRRTRAPLRGLALACWTRLLGSLPGVGDWIERRQASLEIEADRYALSAGASVAALASALLKCDRSPVPRSFAFGSAADLRLRGLLDPDPSTKSPAGVPLEWLAPVGLSLVVGFCHLLAG